MNNNTSRIPELVIAIFLVGMCIFMLYLADGALKRGNIKAASFYAATSYGTFLALILSFAQELKGVNHQNDAHKNKSASMKTVEVFTPNKTFQHHTSTKTRNGYVYLLAALHDPALFKIGRTNNPDKRRRNFEIKLPFAIEYTCVIQTDDMYKLERELHSKYRSKRLDGEWFKLSSEDVEYIKGLTHVSS